MDESNEWEAIVNQILQMGKIEGDNRAIMRQLGQMTGSYYLGLIDAGLTLDQSAWMIHWSLLTIGRLKKEGLL